MIQGTGVSKQGYMSVRHVIELRNVSIRERKFSDKRKDSMQFINHIQDYRKFQPHDFNMGVSANSTSATYFI